jgi:hypothetical protein
MKLKCNTISGLLIWRFMMAATVHMLRPLTPPIAGYLRVGHTGHRKLVDLHAGGRLSFRRIVFDAAYFDEQAELAKTLKASGARLSSTRISLKWLRLVVLDRRQCKNCLGRILAVRSNLRILVGGVIRMLRRRSQSSRSRQVCMRCLRPLTCLTN